MWLCYSHDASVCLLQDGIPRVAIQKERLSRKKHDGNITNINLDECIQYCLDEAGIVLEDISLFIENSPTLLYCKEKDTILWYSVPRLLDWVDQKKIIQISHHLAHAYAVFWASPFTKSSVMIIDGQWNYREDITEDISDASIFPKNAESSYIERESFYDFEEHTFQTLRKNMWKVHKSFISICWIGHLYEKVASYIFRSRFDAGKLMWLAPFGHNTNKKNLLEIGENWEIIYDAEWGRVYKNPNYDGKQLETHWEEYCDLAFKTQSEIEKAILFLSQWLNKHSKHSQLCYSWWVSLNCSANNLVIKDSGFQELFILPVASDAWISIWCAYYWYLHILQKPKISYQYSDYLGKEYTSEAILKTIQTFDWKIQYKKSHLVTQLTAEYLSQGKIIGWFQSRSEFWPRALWNRSILADPREPNMQKILNQRVKCREWFRPFAPSVLEEYASEYFSLSKSPFMLYTAFVKEEKKLLVPSIVHIDGSARIQTVNQQQNKKYYKLISDFFKITGVPMIINTSFNKDEPIVETPQDAIHCFLSTNIDVLILDDYIVTKN